MPSRSSYWLEAVVLFCCFVVYAGSMAPMVNESHYLTKARHFWDAGYGKGDLFLESKDAHWFFFLTFGWLTNVLPLPWAAMVGRVLSWICLSLAWCRLSHCIVPRRWIAPLSGTFFLAVLHWGHLSGEWVVGGFESKCFAYAAILMSLGEIARGKWSMAWGWLGVSCAFHVVTGGWVTLTCAFAFAIRKLRGAEPELWRQQVVPCVLGGTVSLLGMIPALLLNRGVDPQTVSRGAMIYVFDRLPHHLLASRFALYRWQCFSVLMIVVVAVGVAFWYRSRQMGWMKSFCVEADPRNQRVESDSIRSAMDALSRLWWIALGSLLLAIIGYWIDRFLSALQPELAASLLRFYWFRWNDVAWPLVLAMTIAVWYHLSNARFWEKAVTGLAMLVPAMILLGTSFDSQMNQRYPDADRNSLLLRSEPAYLQEQTHRDWLAVCRWISENTPEDSLWMTPRYQQTFKWYSGRSEFVCWKDSPQDAIGLVEWRQRLSDAYRFADNGALIETPYKDLITLSMRYDIQYLLIDRRIQKTPPLLPILYPMDERENATFMVFQFIDMPQADSWPVGSPQDVVSPASSAGSPLTK